MVRAIDNLEAQLLGLPSTDRARLAEVLLASLEAPMISVAESEAAWLLEAQRRLEELRAGTVVGIPADQVFADARARNNR